MIDYRWAQPPELAAVAAFFSRTIAQDRSYVSHGEVQTGLSLDGETWVADLDARMVEDLANLGNDRSAAVAYDGATLVGATIVL